MHEVTETRKGERLQAKKKRHGGFRPTKKGLGGAGAGLKKPRVWGVRNVY